MPHRMHRYYFEQWDVLSASCVERGWAAAPNRLLGKGCLSVASSRATLFGVVNQGPVGTCTGKNGFGSFCRNKRDSSAGTKPRLIKFHESFFRPPKYLPNRTYYDMYVDMNEKRKIRRVTANLPADLLEEACQVSGAGVTETLTQGLSLVTRGAALAKASRLRGRLKLDIDLQVSRERPRR